MLIKTANEVSRLHWVEAHIFFGILTTEIFHLGFSLSHGILNWKNILYNDAKLEKGKGLDLLIFVDLKKKTDEKKTSKHGIFDYKMMLILTNKKRLIKLSIITKLYSNMVMLHIHGDVKGQDDKTEFNLNSKMISIY